mgnify:CR=1 FL=1
MSLQQKYKMVKKEYQIIYKFADVIDNIEAESEEDAKKIADERLNGCNLDYDPKVDTSCYEIEVEEIESMGDKT